MQSEVLSNGCLLSFLKKFSNPCKVLSTDDDKNWYRAEQDGCQGMVPYNYIRMKPHEYVIFLDSFIIQLKSF